MRGGARRPQVRRSLSTLNLRPRGRVRQWRGPSLYCARRLHRLPYHSVRRVFPSTAARPARGGPARACFGQACSRHTRPTPSLPPPAVRLAPTPNPRTVSGSAAPPALPCARSLALPQGPSLRSGFCCPRPSSLTRPHPPHSPAPHDFAAPRLIRAALPRRERLGRPRVVPCFRCPFRPDMSPSSTPGSPPAAHAQFLRRRHWPSPVSERLGTPK